MKKGVIVLFLISFMLVGFLGGVSGEVPGAFQVEEGESECEALGHVCGNAISDGAETSCELIGLEWVGDEDLDESCGDKSLTGCCKDKPNLDGEGTSSKPYQITKCEELKEVNKDLEVYYILTKDLYCSGRVDMRPIGSETQLFEGNFNGNYKTIKDLLISEDSASYVGLFGYNVGTIKNVKLTGASIRTLGDYVGCIAGYNKGSIIDSSCQGSVGSVVGGDYVGGLVGENGIYAEIKGSYFEGRGDTIDAIEDVIGDDYIGGLVGKNRGTISESYSFNGDVKGDNYVGGLVGVNSKYIEESYTKIKEVKGNDYIGGLVGKNDNKINDCYSRTLIVRGGDYLGGLVGKNDGEVKRTYSTSNIIGRTNRVIGGLVGWNNDKFATIRDSFSIGSLSGSSEVGGLVGVNSNGIILNNYFYNVEEDSASRCVGSESVSDEKCFLINGIISEPSSLGYGGSDYNFLPLFKGASATTSLILERGGKEPFASWDFVNVWITETNPDDFPILNWELKGITEPICSDGVITIEDGEQCEPPEGINCDKFCHLTDKGILNSISDMYWVDKSDIKVPSVKVGDEVKIVIDKIYFPGGEIKYKIMEEDKWWFVDGEVEEGKFELTPGKRTEYIATWTPGEDGAYYFEIEIEGKKISSKDKDYNRGILSVLKEGEEISYCQDLPRYGTDYMCKANCGGDYPKYLKNYPCENTAGMKCCGVETGIICNNNDIQNTGEECDGGNHCTNCVCETGYTDDPNNNGCVGEIPPVGGDGECGDINFFLDEPEFLGTDPGELCTSTEDFRLIDGYYDEEALTFEWNCGSKLCHGNARQEPIDEKYKSDGNCEGMDESFNIVDEDTGEVLKTIWCPVMLPIFTFRNVIVAIVVIGLIYFWAGKKKRK